ncbi:MAG: radical SAM protein [Patescibacteria group bacterium]
MFISLIETPWIYYRKDAAVVIFPSKPYWFSATPEIGVILDALHLGVPNAIIQKIADSLQLSIQDSGEIYYEIVDLLYSSGVLSKDGKTVEAKEFSPDFQVNDVENVLVIAATQKCNLACPMCYAMANLGTLDEMTTDQIKGVINQLNEMPWQNGISRVALTGGELFTRSDAIELIEYVHNQGFFAQVNTNATLLTDDQIKVLSEFPRLKMSISLDGCQQATHELIRGPGTFEITTKTIRSLCQNGISVAINMFVHAGNVDEIRETILLADSLGASGFNCLNMMNVGRGNSSRTKKLLAGVPLGIFYRKVFEAIRHDQRLQKLMMNSTFANQIMGIAGGVKSHGCGIGTNRAIYVKADGSLYPCADTALPTFRLGNLRTDSLADIWENSPLLRELRFLDIDTMNDQCAICDVRYQCAGNCRGENFQTTKNLKGPHFKCAEIHDSILELMWILTEEPDLFKIKVDDLYGKVNTHAATA